MTNWVDHRLGINGPQAELRRFANCFVRAAGRERFPAYVEGEFDIDVPRPEGEVFFSFEKLSPPRPKDWDRWVLARWGMKYVAVDAKIKADRDALKFSFSTANSVNWAIYEELTELFPLLTIEGDYLEYGFCLWGDVRCH